MSTEQTITNAKETVLSFIKALNDEDFTAARKYVQDDLTFTGVLGTRNGADVYLADMSKMKFKYTIKKAFADGDDVCLYYDIKMGDKTIFSSGWYELVDNRISRFRVIFDPRPLLDNPAQ
jgi:limonene-1,2-epoxide hydrolase